MNLNPNRTTPFRKKLKTDCLIIGFNDADLPSRDYEQILKTLK